MNGRPGAKAASATLVPAQVARDVVARDGAAREAATRNATVRDLAASAAAPRGAAMASTAAASPEPPRGIDRTERAGRTGWIVALAVLLVGAAVTFSVLGEERARPLVLALLAALAVVGVFSLFAAAVGLLQLPGRAARNDLTKLIADGATDGMLVVDGAGRVIYANEAYLALAGAAPGGDPRPVERLFSGGADVAEAVYRLASAAREGKRAVEELRLPSALGGRSGAGWYRVKVRPVEGAGLDRATLWNVADVTRERERQENVFQELQHAIDFLDHAPAGFLSIEPGGAVAYMNATLAGWLDHDIAQIGPGSLTVADVVASASVPLLASAPGASGEVKTAVLDLDLRRRDGQPLPVRLFHRVAHGHDGAPGPSRTLVMNRSAGADGLDGAEGLRAAEVRFARVFNTTPMAIATLDDDNRIVSANGAFARLFATARGGAGSGSGSAGGGAEGPSRGALLDLVAERDRALLAEAIAAARAGQGDVKPVDLALAREEGFAARVFVSPVEMPGKRVDRPGEAVLGDTGSNESVIVYALETTAQRTLEAQFAQAQKMQAVGQLAGGIAHDFNNVLQIIVNSAEFLLASHKPADPSFADIMQIKQNANRAASLVRQLLAFSRRQTLRPQVLELGNVLSDVQLLLKRPLGERIKLDIRQERELWPIKADQGQLEQVLINLTVNARDAMEDGGLLTIRSRNVPAEEAATLDLVGLPAQDFVLIEFADTGSGIPKENLEKIFDPFFTTKEVGKGTGLGLSMVYGIVKQSHGFIYCESEVGRGTTFSIYLPRHVAAPGEAAAPTVAEPKKPAADLTGTGTVLLVEDEDAVRVLNARMLTSRGFTVLQAESGVDALRVVEEHGVERIDLVVSDVVMPEMDGPSLLRELRRRKPDTRVIFVSGYAEDAFRRNLPDGEEFHFLAKPFSTKQLVEKVKEAMAG